MGGVLVVRLLSHERGRPVAANRFRDLEPGGLFAGHSLRRRIEALLRRAAAGRALTGLHLTQRQRPRPLLVVPLRFGVLGDQPPVVVVQVRDLRFPTPEPTGADPQVVDRYFDVSPELRSTLEAAGEKGTLTPPVVAW